jgi:hypothetical protein
LGAAPLLVVLSSFGVALLSFADALSRAGRDGAYWVFWAGIVAVLAPLIVGVTLPRMTRGQLQFLVGAGSLLIYATKVVYAPTAFALSDEFAHLRTTLDILDTHRLFQPNPIIFISPRFPGLEAVTAALASAAGVSPFTAGVIVVGAARLVGLLALFLLLEHVSDSARMAAIGCLVYVGNPNYLYWSAQFAYESLALPLAILALYLLTLAISSPVRSSAFAATLLVVAAVVVTHHLTSYVLLGLIVLAATMARRYDPGHVGVLWVAAAATAAAVAAWNILFARETRYYLGPVVGRAVEHAIEILSRTRPPRAPYTAQNGLVPPVWERVLGYAAVLILLVTLVVTLRLVWRYSPIVGKVLVATALIYPLALPLRLVPDGQEIGNRTSEFVFLGLALTVAVAVHLPSPVFSALSARVAPTVVTAVVVLGGVTASWSFYLRTPPPSTSTRTPLVVDDQQVAAALWAKDELGPNRRFVSDVLSRNALASYGDQHTVTAASDRIRIWSIFFEPSVDGTVVDGLRTGRIDYVLIDRRLIHGPPPNIGIYYDSGEPTQDLPANPLTASTLAKFDGVPGVDRVFDSGQLQIYDVHAIWDGQP